VQRGKGSEEREREGVGTLSPPVTFDSDLVRKCLSGDRVAWAALLQRYADLVYGLLFRAGLDEDARADGFQEVSVLLWKNLKRVQQAERLLPWIATTTRRVAWREKKKRKSRDARDASVAKGEAAPGDAPDVSLAALEEEQAVREALAAMEERCRRLLRALYFEAGGGEYDDVARRLGIPRGSIGPTRKRCLERLRAELAARGIRADDVSGNRSAASIPKTSPAASGEEEPA
jgi:RNA polymerase sigma factor (sigma-70 family)